MGVLPTESITLRLWIYYFLLIALVNPWTHADAFVYPYTYVHSPKLKPFIQVQPSKGLQYRSKCVRDLRQLKRHGSSCRREWFLAHAEEVSSEEEPKSVKEQGNRVPATSFNLIKVLLGSGVLALPSGIAAFSDHRTALIPALSMMTVLGGLSAYTFGLYGRLVHFSQAKSLGEVWEKEKGKESSWIISVSTFTFCFGAALAYSILLGDAFASLASAAGLTGFAATRQSWILLLSATVLFPLCNLKSLLALAPLSIVGVISILTTTGFLGWRCPSINAASPYASPGGALLTSLASKRSPIFGTFDKGITSAASMVLAGMSATAYLGHFSAPGFYYSLQTTNGSDDEDNGDDDTSTLDAKGHPQTLRDYFKVTAYGFGVCTLVNCLVMAFGFLTFGGNCQGVILNNYSTADVGASICRLLMAVCVTGGYPFLIAACRGELLELWKRKSDTTQPSRQMERRVTTILLLILTSTALVTDNAGFVIGFTGAVVGSWIAYSFPAQLYLSRTKNQQNASSITRLERLLCRLLIGFGIISAGIGGAVSLVDNFWPHLMK